MYVAEMLVATPKIIYFLRILDVRWDNYFNLLKLYITNDAIVFLKCKKKKHSNFYSS